MSIYNVVLNFELCIGDPFASHDMNLTNQVCTCEAQIGYNALSLCLHNMVDVIHVSMYNVVFRHGT